MRQPVQQRQHQQRQRGGRQDAADHHRGQRALYFGPGAGGECHRDEAERCHQRRHQHRAQPGEGTFIDRAIQRQAVLAQRADVGNHHESVQHRHARQRDEADAGRDRQRDVTQPQRHDAAGEREGHAGKHQQSVFQVAEHGEQQDEDQQQRHRHHDLQALRGRLQLFEGAAPIDPVTSRQLHIVSDACLRLADEGADVTAAHIGADDHTAFAVFAADLVRPRSHRQSSHFTEGDEIRLAGCVSALRQADWQAFDRLDVGAQVLGQSHHDAEAAVALEHRTGLATAECDAGRLLHVGHIQAEPSRLRSVDINGEDRQTCDLLDLHVGRARNAFQHGRDLGTAGCERAQVVAEHLHRDVAAHA